MYRHGYFLNNYRDVSGTVINSLTKCNIIYYDRLVGLVVSMSEC